MNVSTGDDSVSPGWVVNHFSQANPEGTGQGNVPALLRRVAETIEGLGEVEIQDVVFHVEVLSIDEEDRPSMTVYYHSRDKGEMSEQ